MLLQIIVTAQKDTLYPLLKTIKGDIENFTVDNLDNIYIVNSTGQLKKYNAKGDSVAVFNDVKRYGNVSLVDASNPLKVLLYYKDFSTIVVLDRLLTQRATIDLRKMGIFQVNVISQSYDNNIWLYDEGDSKLKKISDEGKLLSETIDLRLLFDDAPHVTAIADQEGYVYLYDPVQNVFTFDYYGALKNRILITGWNDFKVADKFIYGVKNDSLFRYQINTFRQDEEKLPLPLQKSLKLDFTASRIYAMKKDELSVYLLK